MPGNIVVGILRALLTADAAEYTENLERAGANTLKFGKDLKSFGAGLSSMGEAILPISLAITAIGVGSAKAAIDFQSSFAGIRKTVGDATDATGELTATGQRLAQGMRDMAKEIPVNVNELNKIGEAAGQLGIKSENILGFTRVMADLGVSTNLSSDQAATALARLANITQMPQDKFSNLGSTIVALGNNMATTEAEITEFGLRIAGAGAQVGLSEAQILSIGAALSSVGINAEAGGTAISKVMIDMASSVAEGGERLKMFADVAGMSSKQFKKQFETDAAGALTAFITGLGNMESRGGSALQVLDKMEITETRMRDALLRSAGAGDLLARSIQIGTQAWTDNNALTKEAEQRYKTFESQLTILWNQFKDVAITLGTALLPVLEQAVKIFQSWIPYIQAAATWFAELSPEMKTTIVVVGGLVAALGPMLIAFGAAVTAIGGLITALATIGISLTAFLSGIGLVVAAIGGMTYVWLRWGDDIKRIASETIDAVTKFFVDRFNAIVDNIKAKIDAVKGFFKGMYDAVAGNSYVPDMIAEIGRQFDLLEPFMVKKTKSAASMTVTEFSKMAQHVNTYMGMFASAVDIHSQNASGQIINTAKQIDTSLAMIAAAARVNSEEIAATSSITINSLLMIGQAAQIASQDVVNQVPKTIGAFGQLKDGVLDTLGELWEGMSGGKGFGGLMNNLGSSIVQGFGNILSGGLTQVINMGVGLAMEGIKKIGSLIGGMFKSEESKYVNEPRDAFFDQFGGYEGLAQQLTSAFEARGDTNAGGAADELIKKLYDADTRAAFQSAQRDIVDLIGGNVFATGTPGLGPIDFGAGSLAMLHGREAVIPEARMGEFAATHGPDQTINIYMDSVLVTQRVVRNMPRVLALHGVG